MHYVRIDTSDSDTRWINMHMVSRVTLATDASSGHPIMVLFFESPEASLTIRGSDDRNRSAIQQLSEALDYLTTPVAAGTH